MFDIISIGAATIDILVKSPDFIIKKNTISLLRSSKNEISQGIICSGGGATNSSVAFSRLGLKTACVSLLGRDYLSQYILDDLEINNVHSFLSFDHHGTDYSVILVAHDGSRSILTHRGPSRLEETQIPFNRLRSTRWLYLTSLEGNLDLLEKLIGFALENNIKIALNPGNRELKSRSRLLSLLPHLDFLLLNDVESHTLTQSENLSLIISRLRSYGSRLFAITSGRHGAYVVTSEKKYYSPIINVSPVDETGAGDAFGSAFVAGLLHHLDPPSSLLWGIKNSASVVASLGAKSGLLTYKQIK